MLKTNAVRVLDGLEIKYELREYKVDPDDLSAETVAAKIGLPAEQLFKPLVARGDRNGVSLAVISANDELNFQALAHQTGDRKIDMLPLREVQAATGYISWRSYGSGVQELRGDISISMDERLTNLARSRRLHPSRESSDRAYR